MVNRFPAPSPNATHDALANAGLVLPSGNQIDLDQDGQIVDERAMLAELVAKLVEDPGALAKRRCNLTTGAAIHPTVALRAVLTGHVRRVVVDSRNVVTELGTRSRVFTGAAREAALLLSNFCGHAGCEIRARHGQVDHIVEWAEGGETNQSNAQPRCGPHNRFKHRERWQSKRDQRGRTYDIRPDNTIVLPVGERPPDLSHDEVDELTRRRVRELCTR